MDIIDPYDVEPTVNAASAEHRDGRQVHRRILSPLRGGPASIDIGFNLSATGLDHADPYAYDHDEYCYTAAGSARMQSDGQTVDFAAGQFMWRPAGAATQRFTVTKAYNSLCAFGPARSDAWSHLKPASYHMETKAADRPQVRFVKPQDVVPLDKGDAGIAQRIIFNTPRMEIAHFTLAQGSKTVIGQGGRDEIYFLETGALKVENRPHTETIEQGRFLIITANQPIHLLTATQGSVLIRWSAPAIPG